MIQIPIVRSALLLSALGGLVLVVSGVLLHRTIDQLRTDRLLVDQRDRIGREFERLLRDLQETEPQRAAVKSLRPDRKNLVRFVQGLEAAAAGAFIDQQITAILPESDHGGQPYPLPVVRYRVTLQGTLEKVEAYLRFLTGLPELVRAERLELKTTPDGHIVTNAIAELLLAVAVAETP